MRSQVRVTTARCCSHSSSLAISSRGACSAPSFTPGRSPCSISSSPAPGHSNTRGRAPAYYFCSLSSWRSRRTRGGVVCSLPRWASCYSAGAGPCWCGIDEVDHECTEGKMVHLIVEQTFETPLTDEEHGRLGQELDKCLIAYGAR